MKIDDQNPSRKKPDAKETDVIDFIAFRQKKQTDEEFARGRQPLYVSHLTGKISGKPASENSEANQSDTEGVDFGDRLQRIRTSLDKINRLMSELKRMSSNETPFDRRGHDRRR